MWGTSLAWRVEGSSPTAGGWRVTDSNGGRCFFNPKKFQSTIIRPGRCTSPSLTQFLQLPKCVSLKAARGHATKDKPTTNTMLWCGLHTRMTFTTLAYSSHGGCVFHLTSALRPPLTSGVLAQSSFKLQQFLCSRGYAMDNLDEAQRIHPS